MVAELMRDQVAADDLVVDVPLRQHLVVEKVAERPVPDIVQQARETQGLLDQGRRGRVRKGRTQRRVNSARKETGEVHRAKQVHEARVLCAGEHPPGRLQLMHAAQPLQPR